MLIIHYEHPDNEIMKMKLQQISTEPVEADRYKVTLTGKIEGVPDSITLHVILIEDQYLAFPRAISKAMTERADLYISKRLIEVNNGIVVNIFQEER